MLNFFKKPTAQMLTITELEIAQCSLLQAHSGLEWAIAQVTYNEARVKRLTVAASQPIISFPSLV